MTSSKARVYAEMLVEMIIASDAFARDEQGGRLPKPQKGFYQEHGFYLDSEGQDSVDYGVSTETNQMLEKYLRWNKGTEL
jgi:hypothetical protein